MEKNMEARAWGLGFRTLIVEDRMGQAFVGPEGERHGDLEWVLHS